MFDFDLRFEPSDTLLSVWPKIRMNVVKLGEVTSMEYFHRIDPNINKFLMILKYLTPTRKKFDLIAKKFIVHDKVWLLFVHNKITSFDIHCVSFSTIMT